MIAGAASAETVKITNIGHGYFSGALYVAVQEKLFQKYGLEPDISYVQGGPLALQAVLTKQADIGILSYEHVLTVAVQGKRIVAFFNIANRPVNNVIASEKLIAGSEKLDIAEKIKKLKGQRVAMPSANGSGEKMLRCPGEKVRTYAARGYFMPCTSEPKRHLMSPPFRKILSTQHCRSNRPASWCSNPEMARSIST